MTGMLLMFWACGPASVEVVGDNKLTTNPDNTQVDDTGTGDDTASTDDSGTTVPTPTADLSEWHGTRHYVYQSDWFSCDETINENGTLLDATAPEVQTLQAECPSCTHFYEVTPEVDSVCRYVSLGTNYRAVTFVEGQANTVQIYYIYDTPTLVGGDSAASWDGSNLDYAYIFNYYGADINVDGHVSFPLQ